MNKTLTLAVAALLAAGMAQAKVDLVTLPTRDKVQLTIYNSADLTLVREQRLLTLKKGLNTLQFSWENTLIDPTSLQMVPKENAKDIEVFDLTYPPRVRNVGVWHIRSKVSGMVPFEITYLTSGIGWRAFYMGTLTPDEKLMRLQGYVRVTNGSGEEYEDAQTRLIVGKVHILDQIAALAQRQYPYGSPVPVPKNSPPPAPSAQPVEQRMQVKRAYGAVGSAPEKQVIKEGLSEYFLYTIEGTETIPNAWSKRLPSFEAAEVPVVNLYKYEEERYGPAVVRFLSFKNDEAHKLGQTPIPDGTMKVYRKADAAGSLSYEGQSSFKYIPVNEDVELSLGAVANVVVEPTLMNFKSENFAYNSDGNIESWDEVRDWKLVVKNTRDTAVRVEIRRNFNCRKWELNKSGEFGEFETVDLDTVKFTLDLGPKEKKEFLYVLRTAHGQRGQ